MEVSHSPESLMLFWKYRLDYHDGTSIQLKRLLMGGDYLFWHVHSMPEGRGLGSYGGSYCPLYVPSRFPFSLRVGGGLCTWLWQSWLVRQAYRFQLRRTAHRSGKPIPSLAYVSVFDEDYAGHVLQLLGEDDQMKVMLHLMDLQVHPGRSLSDYPNLRRLLERASVVRCVSQCIKESIGASCRVEPKVLGLASGIKRSISPDDHLPTEKVLLMTGALYDAAPDKLRFFERVFLPAWHRFRSEIAPDARLCYAGPSFAHLPDHLKVHVENLGLLTAADFSRVLSEATASLLPIEHEADSWWRYSIPSRVVDLISAGIPVLASPSKGTAGGEFLREREGQGIYLCQTSEECFQVLKRLFMDISAQRADRQALALLARQHEPSFLRSIVQDDIQRLSVGSC